MEVRDERYLDPFFFAAYTSEAFLPLSWGWFKFSETRGESDTNEEKITHRQRPP
jgi:hypothetical protein